MPFAHQFTLNGATTSEVYSHNGYAQTTKYRREGSVNPVEATVTYTVASRDTGNISGITVAAASSAPDFPNNETYTKVTNSERLSAWAQTSGPSETISYDNAGRIQSTTGAGGLANRTYTYNSFNLPTRIVNGNVTTDFTYDAFGKRTKKRRDANNQVLYVGNLYEQRTLASPNTKEAVFRLVTDEGVAGEVVKNFSTGAVTRRMFQNDRQGSPFFMTVGTSASLYGAFGPYGRRINAAPAQNMSNLGYTGMSWTTIPRAHQHERAHLRQSSPALLDPHRARRAVRWPGRSQCLWVRARQPHRSRRPLGVRGRGREQRRQRGQDGDEHQRRARLRPNPRSRD